MKKIISILTICFAMLLTGCGNNPFGADVSQKLENQKGEIDDLRNNQNGFMLELMKVRQENQIQARDIANNQQGLVNSNKSNSGVQIFSGDGGLIIVLALGAVAMLLVYHYKTKAKKSEETAEILAQQVGQYNDPNLDNDIFLAAMNTKVEGDVYKLMTKNKQSKYARN